MWKISWIGSLNMSSSWKIEKRDMEKKLAVLADKLEEYRADEDSLRTALLGAQKLVTA